MHEDTTYEAPGVGGGISRRDMLRKSAVVGGAGALMWAAPSITKYGSAAFGDTAGTPVGNKGLSYIALIYSCTTGDRYIKFDLADGSVGVQTKDTNYTCTTGDTFATPGCEDQFPQNRSSDTPYDEDCDKFTIEYLEVDESGKPLRATITIDEPCYMEGTAFAKCGNPDQPQSGGECTAPDTVSGTSITFNSCGT